MEVPEEFLLTELWFAENRGGHPECQTIVQAIMLVPGILKWETFRGYTLHALVTNFRCVGILPTKGLERGQTHDEIHPMDLLFLHEWSSTCCCCSCVCLCHSFLLFFFCVSLKKLLVLGMSVGLDF